ncbi:MAG: penicillin acylase family protein [Rhodospirillaceae bacterium]|nr:penicillin acylase family protein [Rhodospirillaceae bacterium]MBT6089377.1 penicillin acylase family protein [Rhodospirillaceae bacterium]
MTVALGIAWLTFQSLPQVAGNIPMPGPTSSIEISRNESGIPFIRAENEGDAYFALGYVHAQDRLFQMDFMRRLAAGRLSEVLGAQGLGSDRFMRTLGLYRHAEANLSVLAPETIHVLKRYADGVNAWLEHRQKPLPPEFQLLNYEPFSWTPADSLVWQKLMGLSLAGNWRDELLRSRLLQILSPEQVAQLWPGLQPGSPTTIAAINTQVSEELAQSLIGTIDDYAPPTLASNIWVLDGQHTQSGKPLLASDPHLGYQSPLVWYLARLEWPGEVRVGATTPGFPFTVIGHNGHTAWGMTTTHADLQDIFIEQVTDDGRYLTPNGPQDFALRTEVIDVRFSDPVTLKIRSTRHGPVVSDLAAFSSPELNTGADAKTVLALSTTLLHDHDRTANAILNVGSSRTVDDIKAALSQFEGPQQNFMYADTDGGIGFSAAAYVPIRADGDGTVPVPGWSGEYDWIGRVPYEELPHRLRPTSGRMVNANNRPVPDDYPHLIAATFPAGYRAKRIGQRLDEIAPSTAEVADMEEIQVDAISTMVHDLLPILLNTTQPRTDRAGRVIDLLRAWDGSMNRDRPEPLLFLSWLDFVKEAALKDELGGVYSAYRGGRPKLIRQILTNWQAWCDVTTTTTVESCAAITSDALERSLDWLAERPETSGDDPSQWRWGDFHRAQFTHPLFNLIPGLSSLTKVEIESDGSDHTVNRGAYRSARGRQPFINTHGAGLRSVFDLANLDQSSFMIAVGQSGHPLSVHYDDLNQPWRDGKSLTMPSLGTFVPSSTLRLEPLVNSAD